MTKCRNCWEIDSSVWVKQHYSAGFKHFFFNTTPPPQGKSPELELRTRSDLAKTMLECPPLAQLRQGTEGSLLYSLNRRRLKGRDQNLNIWANAECLDQVDFLILHTSGMTEHPEEQLFKTYSLLFYTGPGRTSVLCLLQCLFHVKFHLDLSWSENP